MNPILLALFFITAILYASVGFGGGSTYTALLVLVDANYLIIPIISLSCNILVVSGNSVQYIRSGFVSIRTVWPFLVLSVPMAWVGGFIQIPHLYFIGLLSVSLLFAGISLLFKKTPTESKYTASPLPATALIGGGLGLLSGMVGIGGGIFLAPILHKISWGSSKHIAALCSLFILVNSISGLNGQLMKHGSIQTMQSAQAYWLLLPMVVVGGFIGNRLNLKVFSENMIRKMTALLILFVAMRLLFKFFTLLTG